MINPPPDKEGVVKLLRQVIRRYYGSQYRITFRRREHQHRHLKTIFPPDRLFNLVCYPGGISIGGEDHIAGLNISGDLAEAQSLIQDL